MDVRVRQEQQLSPSVSSHKRRNRWATQIPLNPAMMPPGTPGTGENLCPACSGTGKLDGENCPECKGTGKVTTGIGGG